MTQIEEAKADYIRTKDQMVHALTTTPDERVNWSPSPTSRTPAQLVAHSASAVENIRTQLAGTPFPIPNSALADETFREWEHSIVTREQAIGLLEENSQKFLDWLEALTPEDLEGSAVMPFGLGRAPISLGITFPAMHLRYHIGQLDYVQTIYGDRDWHTGY